MNIFSNKKCDLGVSSFGLTRGQVDDMLKHSHSSTDTRCVICGNTAQYKLVPKDDRYNTAQIEDKGYVCGNCLSTNPNIDRNQYGIRDLNE